MHKLRTQKTKVGQNVGLTTNKTDPRGNQGKENLII